MMLMLPETTDPNGQHNGHQVDIKNLLLAQLVCKQQAKIRNLPKKEELGSYILFCWTFLEFKDILQLVLCQKCNSHTKDKSFHIWTHTLFALRRFNILILKFLDYIPSLFDLCCKASLCLDKSFDFLFVQQKHILASH